MNNERIDKYEVLRRLALAGARGDDLGPTVETALRQAAELVSLEAAAVFLWDDQMDTTMSVAHAVDDDVRKTLSSLEEDLFRSLRQQRRMVSAYISFAGDRPLQSFTLPLVHDTRTFGAVIGIQHGEGRLVSEDEFLEALSAAIAINIAAEGMGKDTTIDKALIDREKLGAVVETAVTVNHEINNPLTAILGNVQLLLLKNENLDDELKAKLRTIEISAMKIRDVTQRLLKLTSVRSVPYADGTNMLDLSEGDKTDDSAD